MVAGDRAPLCEAWRGRRENVAKERHVSTTPRRPPGRDERDPPWPQAVSGGHRRSQTDPLRDRSSCRRCRVPGSAPRGASDCGGASLLSGAVVFQDRARRAGPAVIALSAHLAGWNGGTTACSRGRLRPGTSPDSGGGVAWADVRQLRNTIVNHQKLSKHGM